ncbi:PhnA domain-containing protein [Vibrio sp. SS-MA-C1-2]|uniref:PhnA domain-containing protein n=1 Tax=Vibrio sp. SS-MA-C1-2 TaxID=2908646 RepID=UPI001F369BB3|nr:PhnA domain-containing protein [Vibrio sp. SS-MA-C1-2]UJF19926.1 PhnA domain-containing protein [Vibrio sp. SS-MA-C1-2]
MAVEKILMERSGAKCELCGADSDLAVFEVSPSDGTANEAILACATCRGQMEPSVELDPNHWRCLNDSMWSPELAVQVMSWRMLKRLSSESWALDLLDMMYLDDDAQTWAAAGLVDDDAEKPRDVNGVELKKGDDITIIKDLPVKGTNQVIKQGTVVRGIRLSDDPKLVSGKANGQSMYIIAEYSRKK